MMMKNRKRWRYLFFLLLPINLIMSLDRNVMVMAAPVMQKEWGLSITQMSFILSSLSWSYALCQLPISTLVQRFGFRVMLALAVLFWSIFTGLMPFATGFSLLIFLRVLIGIAQSPDWTSCVSALKVWFLNEERGQASAILLAALYIGPVIGGPLTGWIIANGNWQQAFIIYGSVGFILAAVWWCVTKRVNKNHHYADVDQSNRDIWRQVRCMLKYRRVWALGILYFSVVSVQSFFASWLPTYLVQERKISIFSSGFYSAMPWFCLYLSVLVSGYVSDVILKHWKSVWLARIPGVIIGLTVGVVSLAVVPLITSFPSMTVVLCLSLAGVGLAQVSVWTSVQDIVRDEASVLAGWVGLWGNLSTAIIPLIMAFIVRITGEWNYVFCFPAIFLFLGVYAALIVRPQVTAEWVEKTGKV